MFNEPGHPAATGGYVVLYHRWVGRLCVEDLSHRLVTVDTEFSTAPVIHTEKHLLAEAPEILLCMVSGG